MARKVNQEQALFLMNELMNLIDVDQYTSNNEDETGIELNDGPRTFAITVHRKASDKMGNITYFQIASQQEEMYIYTQSEDPTTKKRSNGRTIELSIEYDYAWRALSTVHREFKKRLMPFLNKQEALRKELVEKNKVKSESDFNDKMAIMFPELVDKILLGDDKDVK